MSLEGQYEYLCAKGHKWQQNVHDDREPTCPWCAKSPKVFYLQDDTNCNPVRLVFELMEEEAQTCPCCTGKGFVTVPRYRVPTPNTLLPAEQWDGQSTWHKTDSMRAKKYKP